MEHRRPDHAAPGDALAGGPVRAARTAGTGRPGDTRVAGAPPAPAADAPGTAPDTAPDSMPGTAPDAAPDAAPDTAPDPIPAPGRAPSPAGGQAPPSRSSGGRPAAAAPEKLFDPAESERFRERWREVQSAFVDDPGESVRRADALASEAVEALGRAIAAHRRTLSGTAEDHGRDDTERLRLALRGYRDLLERIYAA